MAASVARAVQNVRPHMALIKFPPRVHASLAFDPSKTPAAPVSQPPAATSPAVRNIFSADLPSSQIAPSYQGKIGSTPRGSGMDFHLLPERLKRRPIEDAEIEFINRGGPE